MVFKQAVFPPFQVKRKEKGESTGCLLLQGQALQCLHIVAQVKEMPRGAEPMSTKLLRTCNVG